MVKDITSNKEDEIMNETDKKENSNEICILYIEDNDDDYLLAKHSLEKDKNIAISVTRASNWLEGLNLIHNNEFEILLLDYKLPDKNGLEIIELLRKENINIPIIMLTGGGNEHIAVDAMKEGVWDYFTKDDLHEGKIAKSIQRIVDLTNFMKKWDDHSVELSGLSKKRDAISIMGTALSASVNGVNKTNLMYKTNLNSESIKKYLHFLLNNDFLTEHTVNGKEIYTTTEKGMLLLKQLHEIKKYFG